MKPLVILIGVFGLSCAIVYLKGGQTINYRLNGRIAMATMLAFTSVAHFVFWRGMVLMLPQFLPYKKEIVYFTGIVEVLAAVGLLFPTTSFVTGVGLIVFFVAILPANFIDAMKRVNLEKADYTGNGLAYLWFRIPLQLFFIVWVYACALC